MNKWANMKNPPHTVQETFGLAIKTETQIQVADSFKITNNFALADINKISADETSSDEFKVNEVSRGKKWSNNNYRKNGYSKNRNFSNKNRYNNKTQDSKSGNIWECIERETKLPSYRIHLISFLQNLVSHFQAIQHIHVIEERTQETR